MAEAKMDSEILPVILCGGSGTRLWPLSRKAYPKQFVPLLDGKSLLALTLERVKSISPRVQTVASQAHRFLVQDATQAAGVVAQHLLEPVARNTAAAMAVAALNARPDQLLLFLPADHHIPDAVAFAAAVEKGVPAARRGYIVTFGVYPAFPSTAYGYIKQGKALDEHIWSVERFVEKPDAQKARQLLLAGGHFWNAGIFLVQASTLLEALALHAPAILASCRQATEKQTLDGSFTRLDEAAFSACPAVSFDYAVLEHHDKIAMIPFAGQWSDVGSWNAVAELAPADEHDNRIVGHGWALQSSNTYIHAPHRAVVALGTEDLLIKRLTVKPGGKLSLQLHHHRAEHWVVVQGTARVTCGEETYLLKENESTYIPVGIKHRLENPGSTPLEMIEVQTGSYLDESDIVRFEDHYGRQ